MNARVALALLSVPAVALLCLSHGCARNETTVSPDHITGSGRIVSEVRSMPAFTGIRIISYAKVVITQDTVQALVIDADDNILPLIQTQVAGGILIVELPEGSYDNITVVVHASMRSVTLLESTGAADFVVTRPLACDVLTCRITGAGSFVLSGTADTENIIITGAGNVRNFGLSALKCSALISGAGSIEVTVRQRLDATITGTGSITYAGNPAVVNTSVMGVGSIKPQ